MATVNNIRCCGLTKAYKALTDSRKGCLSDCNLYSTALLQYQILSLAEYTAESCLTEAQYNTLLQGLTLVCGCCSDDNVFDNPATDMENNVPCYCYTITAITGTCSVSYIDCSGVPQTVSSGVDPVYICAQEGTVSPACLAPGNSVNITGGICACDGTAPIPPPPLGPINGPTSDICGASNVNYSLNTSSACTYNWIAPEGATISGPSNLNAANITFSTEFEGGTITVQGFSNTCGVATSSIYVSAIPSPPELTPLTICPDSSELYTASTPAATSYNWTLTGDIDFQQCTNPPLCSQYFVIWGPSGIGSLSVTATNACGFTSDPTVITGTGDC